LLSPTTLPDAPIVLMSSTIVGAPRCSSSWAVITSTDCAPPSGVPARKVPVTTTSSTSVAAFCAQAPSAAARTARADTPNPKAHLFILPSLIFVN